MSSAIARRVSSGQSAAATVTSASLLAAKQATAKAQASRESHNNRDANSAKAAKLDAVHITSVEIDGLVLMNILQHSHDSAPESVSGSLLGVEERGTLKATASFEHPVNFSIQHDLADSQDTYVADMVKHLSVVNCDANLVGWYQSVESVGASLNSLLCEQVAAVQRINPLAVFLLYDRSASLRTKLCVIRAFRMSDAFLTCHENKSVSYQDFAEAQLDSTNIFKELPVKIHNSSLASGFLFEVAALQSSLSGDPVSLVQSFNPCASLPQASQQEADRLSLSFTPQLEKSFQLLSSCCDDYAMEQSRFQYFQRSQARQQAIASNFIAAKTAENEERAAQGKEPAHDMSQLASLNPSIFKSVVKPSRLDSYCISRQMSHYTTQIKQTLNIGIEKLRAIEALQKGMQHEAQPEQQQAAAH